MSLAQLEEIITRVAKSQEETARQMKETDLHMKETSLKMQETDRQMKETDRKLKKLEELFTGQWGKLVEALVDAGLPTLFQEVGIDVHQVSRRSEVIINRERIAEIDILLHNGGADVAIEVKTTCRPKDVDEHIKRLGKVHKSVSKYQNEEKKLFGAMAALKYEGEADLYAQRKGLFILKGKEGLFSIGNKTDFKAVAY